MAIWVAFLPVAVTPLWQLVQLPGATVPWSNTAVVQVLVEWQSSQVLPLGRWFAGLPLALLPLWQVAQVPAATVA